MLCNLPPGCSSQYVSSVPLKHVLKIKRQLNPHEYKHRYKVMVKVQLTEGMPSLILISLLVLSYPFPSFRYLCLF